MFILLANYWQDIRSGVENLGGEDPFVKGLALIGMGLVGIGSLFYSARGRKKQPDQRAHINLDLPSDQYFKLETRADKNTGEA